MKDFRADLHCHTTCSDGTSTPEEVVRLAKKNGLSALSITDHDTIDAYSIAVPLCAELGIELIPGVEFSTVFEGVSIHVLGYGFKADNEEILKFCATHLKRRQVRNKGILDLLTNHRMPITEDDLIATVPKGAVIDSRIFGRPHIAQAMVVKGYVGSVQEAFRKYIAEGCSCYIQGPSFGVQETIDLIHRANGVAVIAHPHLIRATHLIPQLLQLNFDGLECYYGRFLAPEQQRWVKIAENRKLLITGGSDYHGTIKPDLPLGSSWIDQNLFEKLKAACVQS